MTFVCVLRSGGVFDPDWVFRLHRQADEHLQPSRSVVLTDFPHVFGAIEHIPFLHNWPAWFSKLELFRPGLFEGPCVYMDLDTLIIRGPGPDSPWWWNIASFPPHLALLDDFYRPAIPASGVMAWIPSPETERIYHDFAANPQCRSGWQHGDGLIIGRYPHQRLQSFFPGVFGSLKAHKLNDGPRGFSVVCQHGKPKFPDLPANHWMRRTWEGR